MAKVEHPPKNENSGNKPPKGVDTAKKEVPTVSFLQEFLAQIKLNKLMKDASGGSAKLSNLKEIEESLSSKNDVEKQGAITRLDDMLSLKKNVEVKAEKMNAGRLVASVEIPAARRDKINQLAATIDANFSKIESNKGMTSNDQLVALNTELELLAMGLEVEVDAVEMEGLSSKLKYLDEVVKARGNIDQGVKTLSPLNFYEDEFRPGEVGNILKLRDVKDADKKIYLSRLEKYKQNVAKELLGSDNKILEDLTPEELLKRMEEATFWKGNKRVLFGSKRWRGYREMEKLDDILIGVEARYTIAFEKKVVEKLSARGRSEEYVRLATQKVLKTKKPFGRAKYDFEKGIPKGKSPYEAIEAEIVISAAKIAKVAEKTSKVVMTGKEGSYSGIVEKSEFNSVDAVQSYVKEQMAAEEANILEAREIAEELEVDFYDPDFLVDLENPETRKALLKKAENKLAPRKLNKFKAYLSKIEAQKGAMGERFTGVQKELVRLSKEAHRSGNYAPYMIKLQAYIDRVGLRETSSDFQFAIVMRQAKDEISRMNADAGGKFDLWQEAQFLPSITTLDEKTFYSLIPRVVNQGRMQYELEGNYANWLAMQVDGKDDQGKDSKRAVSVASFYQRLQRKDVANRVIAAPINGNDGTILKLWVEHIWGDKAELLVPKVKPGEKQIMRIKTADGKILRDINVNYFSMDADSRPDTKHPEKMAIEDFLDQSMWMAHYAEKMWWYSGEWEAFAKDFPGERLPQANKRLLSIGASFRDYGLEYGKFDVGYSELAKAGVLLQDFRTYKASDVIVANMRHTLFDTKRADGKTPLATAAEGEKLGKGIFKALSSYANISEEYNPLSSLRSVEEVRLMGSLEKYNTAEARWNWYRRSQEKMGRKGVVTYQEIQRLRSQPFESLKTTEEEGWFVQSEQVDILFKNLGKQREELGKLDWTPEVLHHLMDKQSFIETGSHRKKGGENLDEFLKNFEYSSVLSYSELRKGSDPIDYQKYSESKMEAASMMTEVLNGVPSLEKLNELFGKMRSYMPPDQVVAWFKAFRERQIQLRTFQTEKYKISMTDLEEWKMKKKRGEITDAHPPSIIIGYNPATFSIKDERGDKWNVTGADGFRVTRKKDTWGNHMKSTRDVPALSAAEIELQNKVYVGQRWLMKEDAEEMLEESFGTSKLINRISKRMGWDSHSKGAKLLKKYSSKAVLLLRKHPLFDDPIWAFWSILNEFNEFRAEVQKEMTKEVVGGH